MSLIVGEHKLDLSGHGAAHDFLIGPALVALDLTALAVIARARIDRETYEILTRP